MSGGSGTDTMTLDCSDIGPGGNSTHTLDNATYDRDGLFGLLSYSSINALTFVGDPGADHFTVLTGLDLTTLTLNGNDNNDTFDVTPNSGTDIFCNGGLPTTGLNERLTLVGGGATGGIFTPNGATGGTYTFANRDPVTFTGIEVFTQPGAAPSAPDLATNDDTGSSNTDNITGLTNLTFSGTGVLADNPVKLFRDGTQVASVTPASTTSWTTDAVLPAGDDTYAMTVRYETTATGLLSNPSPALNVRVDTIAPAQPHVPDLVTGSDSGQSSSDDITNDTTPAFSGTVEPSAVVTLRNGATSVGTATANAISGAYTVTSSALSDGPKSMTVIQKDVAGNTSPASPALSVTIDTLAPAPPAAAPDLQPGSDTGRSNSDNITRNFTPTFTVNGPELIRLLDGGTTILSDYATPPNVTASSMADGNHSITAQSVDVAGNASVPTPALTVRIDTQAPATPGTPDLDPDSDTGVSSTDNITRDTTPTFDGNVEPNADVLLFEGLTVFTQVGTAISDPLTGSYQVTSSPRLAGVRVFHVSLIDVAGNLSFPSSALSITLDTASPGVTVSSFQFLTSQSVRFSFSEDVAATLGVNDLTLFNQTNHTTVPAASIALSYSSPTGTFTFPGFANGTLPDGDYTATLDTAGITDVAGNPLLVANSVLGFFFLNGDANRDRTVNLQDFNILAGNFGQFGRNFSQGDFTYDGVVNLSDFNILAARFGTSVGPQALTRAGAPTSPRIFSEVFAKENLI
jgi:hypothetical protein